jgi:hypothetical protein
MPECLVYCFGSQIAGLCAVGGNLPSCTRFGLHLDKDVYFGGGGELVAKPFGFGECCDPQVSCWLAYKGCLLR